jgi:outer membrane biosynthesis protein TonB
MVTTSFAAHGVVLAALFIVPQFVSHPPPAVVMTISLSGSTPGPQVQGMTAASARPVEEVAPPPRRPEPTPVATAKPNDATAEPTTIPKSKPAASTPAPTAPPKPPPDLRKIYAINDTAPTSSKPTTGRQAQAGTAQSETGVKGLGTGLASGGAGGVKLDVAFCCNEYLELVVSRIREHWQDLPVKGSNVIKFTIEKDGAINGIQIETPSGTEDLDLMSRRALLQTPKLSPLPSGFSGPRLTVHLTVVYGGS